MTETEFYSLKLDDVVFRKSTGTVAVISTQFTLDHKPKPTDSLWANQTWPRRCDTKDQSVKRADIDDWVYLRDLDDLVNYPVAYCNFLSMRMDSLIDHLRGRSIL